MRILEIRRHVYTKEGGARGRGSHLSQAGVEFARMIGSTIGPFAYVASSQLPRALETALALGFAVDDALDLGGELLDAAQDEFAHREQRDNSQLYARYLRLIDADDAVAALGRRQAELWHMIVSRVPVGARDS